MQPNPTELPDFRVIVDFLESIYCDWQFGTAWSILEFRSRESVTSDRRHVRHRRSRMTRFPVNF